MSISSINFKVKVTPHQSEDMQELAFEKGVYWQTSRGAAVEKSATIDHIYSAYLYFEKGKISYGDDESVFAKNKLPTFTPAKAMETLKKLPDTDDPLTYHGVHKQFMSKLNLKINIRYDGDSARDGRRIQTTAFTCGIGWGKNQTTDFRDTKNYSYMYIRGNTLEYGNDETKFKRNPANQVSVDEAIKILTKTAMEWYDVRDKHFKRVR